MLPSSQVQTQPAQEVHAVVTTYTGVRHQPQVLFGLAILCFLAFITVLGPALSPYSSEDTDLLLGATPPSLAHLLGTDDLGRDMAIRLLEGTRLSLVIGLLATTVSVIMGVSYGAAAAFFGGRIDRFMMHAVDILFVLPYTVLVVLLMVLCGRSIYNLFIALGAVQWLLMARIVRGQVLSLMTMDFVAAARLCGVSSWRIIMRHLIPNAMPVVIVYATLSIPSVILDESFLSFIGLGVQAPMASLGTLLADGASAMEVYPWMLAAPCAAIILALLALNMVGEGLRGIADPRALGAKT